MKESELTKARLLLKANAFLTDWEIRFLKTCLTYSNKLSEKQITRFQQIVNKYHKIPTERKPAPLHRTDTVKIRFTRNEILKGKTLRYFPLKKR